MKHEQIRKLKAADARALAEEQAKEVAKLRKKNHEVNLRNQVIREETRRQIRQLAEDTALTLAEDRRRWLKEQEMRREADRKLALATQMISDGHQNWKLKAENAERKLKAVLDWIGRIAEDSEINGSTEFPVGPCDSCGGAYMPIAESIDLGDQGSQSWCVLCGVPEKKEASVRIAVPYDDPSKVNVEGVAV